MRDFTFKSVAKKEDAKKKKMMRKKKKKRRKKEEEEEEAGCGKRNRTIHATEHLPQRSQRICERSIVLIKMRDCSRASPQMHDGRCLRIYFALSNLPHRL